MSFTVYKSSAGSGKTFTLVKEYLCMVLQRPYSFRTILAITFTNKAANELKERVLLYLRELSSDASSENSSVKKFMLPILIKETGLDEAQIKGKAAITLSLILHNYSDFAIGTIDSFVHRIIKSFAYDLKLPLTFEVEMDDEEHLNRAIDILINKIGLDEDLTSILVNFTQLKISEESDWNIEKDLLKFSKTLINEDGRKGVEKIKDLSSDDFKEIARKTSRFNTEFKKKIVAIAKQATDLIHGNNISEKSFYYGTKGIGAYFKKLAKYLNEDFSPNTYVVKTIDEDIWWAKKADDSEINLIDSIKDELRSYYLQIAEILNEDLEKFHLYKIIHKQIYAVAVLNEIGKILEELKHQNNLIHISEFNKRVAEIVFNEPVPFIYERLGERYKNFLIDEFQDTSVLQWQNFIPLIDNSLAEGHFNMIVGDGKQAIYRFRSGEVEQFACLPEFYKAENLPLYKEREENIKRNFREEFLDQNYRSKKEIIKFNNAFFKVISSKLEPEYQNIYKDLEQKYDQDKSGGYVQIEMIADAKGEEWTNQNLQKIRETIDEILSDEFTHKDITVLCRSNDEITSIANFLLEHNYPIITSESLVLSRSAEVNLMVSFFRYLVNPNEKIFKANILKFLVETESVKESLEEVLEFVHPNNANDENRLPEEDVFLDYLKSYDYQINQAQLLSLSVYDLAEELIRLFGFNAKPDPFIQFFLDAIMKSSANEHADIFSFIEWWDRNQGKESVIIPEGMDAIQILSIHKSKGLEFPVVIYPFANNNVRTTISNSWIDLEDDNLPQLHSFYLPLSKKETLKTAYSEVFIQESNKSLLDLLNVLYVVCTRPTERLYIITEHPGTKKSENESVTKLIQYFLQQSSMYDEGLLKYSFGSRGERKKREMEVQDQKLELEIMISENWRNKILMSTNAPDVWDLENPEKNKEWGNLIHLILSKINIKHDAEMVISHFLESGIIRKDDENEVSAVIHKLLNHEVAGSFFKEGIKAKNEAEILLPDGHLFRPDRIIFEENDLIIIDYKTGKLENKHKHQISGYAKSLADMGYENIRKVLIYINEDVQVMELT